jgi:hypothetical protein
MRRGRTSGGGACILVQSTVSTSAAHTTRFVRKLRNKNVYIYPIQRRYDIKGYSTRRAEHGSGLQVPAHSAQALCSAAPPRGSGAGGRTRCQLTSVFLYAALQEYCVAPTRPRPFLAVRGKWLRLASPHARYAGTVLRTTSISFRCWRKDLHLRPWVYESHALTT